ncbi:MAG: AsmA family protein [Pseudomonadota bacterium]
MNNLLLGLGIAVILVLVGALLAPFFIDWSTHRGLVERQIERIAGAPVAIEGALDVTLLPMPRVVGRDVVIGDPADAPVTVDEVSLAVALTPLMQGVIDVRSVELVRPRLTLRLDEEGATAPSGFALPEGADRIAIADVTVREGEVLIDRVGDVEPITVGPINLTASGRSLAGPYRADGVARWNGVPHTLRLATGPLGEAEGLRIRLAVEPSDQPLALDLDGRVALGGGRALYRGGMRLERFGATEPLESWLVEGEMTAEADALSLDSAAIRLGPEDRPVSLGGSLALSWGEAPEFSARIDAERMDLDRLFLTPGGADQGFLDLLAERDVPDLPVPPVPGRLVLGVGSLVAGGNIIENVSTRVRFGTATPVVERLSARLPGMTDLDLSGDVSDGGETVLAETEIETGQGRVFLRWLLGEAAGPLDWIDGRGRIAADLSYGAGRLALSDVRVVFPDLTARGDLEIVPSDGDVPGKLAVSVAADRFPLEGLERLGAFALSEAGEAESPIDVTADIDIATVLARGGEIDGFRLLGAALDRIVTLDRLSIGSTDTARISAEGEIDLSVEGHAGAIDLRLSALSADTFPDLLRRLGADTFADQLAPRLDGLGAVGLSVGLQGDGLTASAVIDGRIAGMAVDVQAETDDLNEILAGRWPEAGLSLTADLVPDDAARLGRLLGLSPPLEAGPGVVSVTLAGAAEDGLDVRLSVDMFETLADLRGRLAIAETDSTETALSLSGEVDSGDAGLLLATLFGLEVPSATLPLSGFLVLSGTDRSYDVEMRQAMLGDQAIGFSGRIQDEGGWKATAEASAETIDLAALVTLLSGTKILAPDVLVETDMLAGAAGIDYLFSDAPFLWRLPETRLQMSVSANRLLLAGDLVADEAQLRLAATSEDVSVDIQSATLFGGALTGEVTLAVAPEGAALTGLMSLENARAEDVAWRRNGRAVLSGDLAFEADLAAQGRSPRALIGGLGGNGRIVLSEPRVQGLSPVAFDDIVAWSDALGRAAQDADPLQVAELFEAYLDSGATEFERIEVPLSVAAGVVRAPTIVFEGGPYDIRASGRADLAGGDLQSQWSLSAADPEDASRVREAGFVFSGDLTAPERGLDVTPLVSYLQIRAFEREVERFEQFDLESELGPAPPDLDETLDGSDAADDAPPDTVSAPETPDPLLEPEPDTTPAEPVEEVAADPEPVATEDDPVPPEPEDTDQAALPQDVVPEPELVPEIAPEPDPAPQPVQPLEPPVTVAPAPGPPIELAPAPPQVQAPAPQLEPEPEPEPSFRLIPEQDWLDPGYNTR